jgi:hypothetical protein
MHPTRGLELGLAARPLHELSQSGAKTIFVRFEGAELTQGSRLGTGAPAEPSRNWGNRNQCASQPIRIELDLDLLKSPSAQLRYGALPQLDREWRTDPR